VKILLFKNVCKHQYSLSEEVSSVVAIAMLLMSRAVVNAVVYNGSLLIPLCCHCTWLICDAAIFVPREAVESVGCSIEYCYCYFV